MTPQARRSAILALDEAIRTVRLYVDASDDSAELARLVGLLPELERCRRHFEMATDPEEES